MSKGTLEKKETPTHYLAGGATISTYMLSQSYGLQQTFLRFSLDS